MSKAWSARFWLTIIAGLTFAWATYSKILDGATVGVIIVGVFHAYFSRTDRVPSDTNGDTATTATMTTTTIPKENP